MKLGYIEKIHPKFFNSDLKLFQKRVRKVKSISNEVSIKYIFQIRDPLSIIDSFINYNKRNPDWGGTHAKDIDAYLINLIDTHKFIYDLYSQEGGLIVKYKNMMDNLPETLLNIYKFLWPESFKKNLKYLNDLSLKTGDFTQRGKFVKSENPFFGSKIGKTEGGSTENKLLFETKEEKIKKIYEYYNLIH